MSTFSQAARLFWAGALAANAVKGVRNIPIFFTTAFVGWLSGASDHPHTLSNLIEDLNVGVVALLPVNLGQLKHLQQWAGKCPS
jgi:hypothetical protein